MPKRKKRKRKKSKTTKPRRFASITESKFIAASQKWKCNCCHKLLSAFYEIDHITPWSSGGLTNLENMQALCVGCHKKKTMLERNGRCMYCLEKVVHSKYFPCPVNEKRKRLKTRA